MIEHNKYFKFYNSCIPVKGDNRAVIYDLQRGSLFFFPNTVIDMLQDNINSKLSNIYKQYPNDDKLVTKYLSYLIENELIFLTDVPENFPDLDITFKKPFHLDILFLEIDTLQLFKIDLLKQLDSLGCIQIVLISKNEIKMKSLKKILTVLEFSKLQVISIVTKFSKESLLENFYPKFPRLRDITFFESKNDAKKELITFSTNNLFKVLTRSISNINDFILNQDAFIESQTNNLFFNRKIYIDDKGHIKHYINDKNSYGNIFSTNIKNVIYSDSFQKLWRITKDEVEECNICEFRYICPDNRIPLKQKDKYIHKTKCNYDAKTNEWK